MSDEPFAAGTGGLPCKAESVDLLAQVCDGRGAELTPHQQECPHCRSRLADYQRLWAPVEVLAAEPIGAPHAIIDRALAYVREIAAGPGPGSTLLPLEEDRDDEDRDTAPATPPGPPTIEEDAVVVGASWVGTRVVLRHARLAAEAVSGVRIALSYLGARSEVADDGAVVLELTVAVDYGQNLHALGARIRTEVIAHVDALSGVRPTTVDVHINDVLPARTPTT